MASSDFGASCGAVLEPVFGRSYQTGEAAGRWPEPHADLRAKL
jgi:hypothetical protein